MKLLLKVSVIAVYALFLNRLCEFLRVGGVNKRLPLIVGLFLFMLILAGITFFISRRQKEKDSNQKSKSKEKIHRYAFIAIAGFMTIIAGYNIYLSGTNDGGKLAWYLDKLFHQEEIKLKQGNLYKTGMDGIIEDIKKEIDLPKQLYLGGSFSLKFNPDGQITKFEFTMYGKNGKNKTEGYLVVYDKKISDKMTVYKDTYLKDTYHKTKQLEILQNTVNAVFLSRPFQTWNELKKPYVLTYSGERDWGYNPEGIIYINKEKKERKADFPLAKIVGCTLSVTFEGYKKTTFPEEKYIPHRYLLVDDIQWIAWEDPRSKLVKDAEEKRQKEMEDTRAASESYLDTKIGYRLYEEDAALGSRFYSLQKTVDSGKTWNVINADPFHGATGMGATLQFLDKNLGFLFIRHNGGANGEFYITKDGGNTITLISLKLPQIDLGGTLYQVYDTPQNVKKEGNKLTLEVGQGTDGDYNGGDSIYLYSDDQGKTWHQK